MKKTIKFFINKIIISILILFLFNYFLAKYLFVLPINIYTVSIVSFFDVFGLLLLLLLRLIVL